jgi:uncharacterized protein YcbK (DUF882 family)
MASVHPDSQLEGTTCARTMVGCDLVANVDCLEVNFWCVPMGLNSGYRTPARQAAVDPSAMDRRHTIGEAADMNITNITDWNYLKYYAKNGVCSYACVEPWDAALDHLHVEYDGGACPNSNW